MKKIDVVWIDGFNYTKREYQKYFPQGHGNRTAIHKTIYVESVGEKLYRTIRKAAYYGLLVVLTAVVLGIIYYMGHTGII